MKMIVISLSIVLPWMIFSFDYFGTFIPNTFRAKGFDYVIGSNFIVNISDSAKIVLGYYFSILIVTLVLIKRSIRIELLKISKYEIILISVSLLVFTIFYSLTLSKDFIYSRYYCLIYPFLYFYLLLLIKSVDNSKLKLIMLGICLVYAITITVTISPLTQKSFEQEFIEDEIINWVLNSTDQNDIVLRSRIGKIGFKTNRKILDPIGIINPEISYYYKNHIIEAFFLKRKPSIIIGNIPSRNIWKFANITLEKEISQDVHTLPRQQLLGNDTFHQTVTIYRLNWH
jgi:hypothetical protein